LQEETLLVSWYFAEIGRAVPTDIEGFANSNGFESTQEFLRALSREYRFVHGEGRICSID